MNSQDPLAYVVSQAAVAVCRDAFHWRDDIRSIFLSAGVPRELYEKYDDPANSKAKIARHVLDDLASRPNGSTIQRKIVEALCQLTKPHKDAPDQIAGRRAIADLKEEATRAAVLVNPDEAVSTARKAAAKRRTDAIAIRRERLGELRDRFLSLHKQVISNQSERQQRGYALERLLADLFQLHGLEYRPSYRIDGEQIDLAFNFRGFTYITEARWRSLPPDFGDLADFKAKVDGKMDGTRGMFVSVAGFDLQIVRHLTNVVRGTRNNIIFVDGVDISRVFEGSVGLIDLLTAKIDAAEQEGVYNG